MQTSAVEFHSILARSNSRENFHVITNITNEAIICEVFGEVSNLWSVETFEPI